MSIATEHMAIATEHMAIATERRALVSERRVLPEPRRTSQGRAPQRRGSIERRRHVGLSAPQGRTHDDRTTCADAAHEPQRISWVAALLGIVATAVVILGFVAMANVRAASLEPVSEGAAAPHGVSVSLDAGAAAELASVGE